MSVLQALLESRDAAQKAYDDFVTPLIEANAALTDEQSAKRSELRGSIEVLDERIDEVDASEKRDAKLAEIRNGIGAGPAKANLEVREATTYGKGSDNSYFMDLIYASNPMSSQNFEARKRLEAASHEAAVEMVSNPSPEKRNYLRSIIAEEKRDGGRDAVKEALRRAEALGATGRGELRTGMDTTGSSGGSFATPVYFIGQYAPYREAGRAFADQCNPQDLPAYGMQVNIPHVTGPAAVATQSSQNTAVTETDPTAGYLTGNLTTLAGQVTVSQQLLDRTGPGFAFDKLVFDQLERDYAPKLDALCLTAALAGAGSITYTDAAGFQLSGISGTTSGTRPTLYSKISGAKNAIRKGAGTFMTPTHLFMDPSRWEFISAWGDSNGRPVVVPDLAGPFNAAAAGNSDGAVGVEGATGYRLNGLPVFTDANIPVPGAGADQAIVGNLNEVYKFEGTPIPRVLPQTLGGQLSTLLQLYSYATVIVRYPIAVQSISGTGMAAISF